MLWSPRALNASNSSTSSSMPIASNSSIIQAQPWPWLTLRLLFDGFLQDGRCPMSSNFQHRSFDLPGIYRSTSSSTSTSTSFQLRSSHPSRFVSPILQASILRSFRHRSSGTSGADPSRSYPSIHQAPILRTCRHPSFKLRSSEPSGADPLAQLLLRGVKPTNFVKPLNARKKHTHIVFFHRRDPFYYARFSSTQVPINHNLFNQPTFFMPNFSLLKIFT